MRRPLPSLLLTSLIFAALIGCSGQQPSSPAATGGSSASGGSATTGGSSATGGSSTAGGSAGEGTAAAAGSEANGGSGGSGAARNVPASCVEAAVPYLLATTELDVSFVPSLQEGGWSGDLRPQLPVAVTGDNTVYVGFTRDDGGGSYSAVIAGTTESSPSAEFADAALAGVAVTANGFAALLFDPNSNVDERRWAAVAQHTTGGSGDFNSDLFRSPNLADVGTKGAPDTARLAYLAETDELIAYFGHTERSGDNVRHQGGYLASIAGDGAATELSGWFGSHNLDQRLLVDGDHVAQVGLGDAYPKGIFFSFTDDPQTHVIFQLAADSSGTANGQLGGMVDLGDAIVVPFITNNSISQTLDPGPWPDPDQTIAEQIRTAARAGTDLGLLTVTKGSPLPEGDLTPIWVDTQLAEGARLHNLKSARYGSGQLILLAWQETTGDGDSAISHYYTMVVDAQGNVCQPKTELDASYAFRSGDDIVLRGDGAVVWANEQSGRIRLLTLTP